MAVPDLYARLPGGLGNQELIVNRGSPFHLEGDHERVVLQDHRGPHDFVTYHRAGRTEVLGDWEPAVDAPDEDDFSGRREFVSDLKRDEGGFRWMVAPRLTGKAAMAATTHPRSISIRAPGSRAHQMGWLVSSLVRPFGSIGGRRDAATAREPFLEGLLEASDGIRHLRCHQQTDIAEEVLSESLREG